MQSDNSQPTWTSDSLQRGNACLRCRRRRVKCDGQKPTCGTCIRSCQREDCEYTDGQGPTRTQLLEQDISRLEARIRELEYPDDGSSVKLFNPYHESRQPSMSPQKVTAPSSPSSTSGRISSSHASSSTSSSQWKGIAVSHATSIDVPEVPDIWWNQADLPLATETAIVDDFLLHAFEFGFFLNHDRFRNSVFFASIPEQRPIPALLSTVHLLGVHVSEREDLITQESTLLCQAVRQTSIALSSNHPKKVLHTIQAEVLLAHYFFRTSRLLEGRYHCNAAISLSIGSGMHRIRSTRTLLPVMQFIGDIQSSLPAPQDAVEEGEMINGFWTAFILDRCWSTCLGTPSLMTDDDALGTQIDIPWPLDMDGYERGRLSGNLRGDRTLQKFLSNSPGRVQDGPSSLANLVRASLLFEQATRLRRQWISHGQQQGSAVLRKAFVSLNNCIDHLVKHLPPLDKLDDTLPASASNFIIAHTLAHAAIIKLYSIPGSQKTDSKTKCIESAKTIVDITQHIDRGQTVFLNPILEMLFIVAGEFLIDSIRLGRGSAKNEAQQLERLVAVMAVFGKNSPLTRNQLSKVQEAYESI